MNTVEGQCEPDLARVREVFTDVIEADPAGSAVAVWRGGRFVVDLWGGWADAARTRPWERDTLVMPYSVSKPLAAACVLLLVARGRLGLDDPARRHWPQLRADATVRQLLDHSAGLVALDRPTTTATFYDWDDLCARLADQDPRWPPGTAVGEAALVYGHLLGELVRRVDGRSIGAFLREEVCRPLDLDVHLGLATADLARVADLVAAPGFPGDGGGPIKDAALGNPPGATDPAVVNSAAWRRSEIPAVNVHATARGIAGFFAALATGEILPPTLVEEMSSVQAEGVDAVTGHEARWGLGVGVEPDGWGMGGIGGSVGWWSTDGEYAFAFVTAYLDDHDRATRLENTLRDLIGLPPV